MNKISTLDQRHSVDAQALNLTSKLQTKFESKSSILERLRYFASSVPDFRRTNKGNIRHRLCDIIMLMILSRASGCVERADIVEFGRHNIFQFRKLGMLGNGVPSEATLRRVDNGIDELAMADKMRQFIDLFHTELQKSIKGKEIICIDGKAERGTVLENGRNPDIVSAYSFNTGMTLATEACQEKSNEIKAVPLLIDRLDIAGKIITADAMSMQKDIIDKIREKGGDFLIELKANQRTLRHGIEDGIKTHEYVYSDTQGPELGHGRIETRTYRVYDGLDLIADKEKWGGNMTVIEFESETIRKSTGVRTNEKRLYVSSLPLNTPALGTIVRDHWSIESMHWCLDRNLHQDKIKRRSGRLARNPDTIQRIVHAVFAIWKCRRKKRTDKRKGVAQLMRYVSKSFTKLIGLLNQK